MQDVHRRRVLWRGTNTVVLTVAVLALLVLANVFAGRFSWRYDATANKLYTLSDSTRQVLAGLDRDVTIYGFIQENTPEGQSLSKLLNEYELASPRVQVELVDPERQPALARRYEVDMVNSIVVRVDDDFRKIDPLSLFGYAPEGGVELRGEQAITRALLELTGRGGKKVYFLTGHGEGTPGRELNVLQDLLEGEALKVETLNLIQSGKVPEDAAVIAIAGPTRDLVERERQLLEEYARKGGRLLILYGPQPPGQELSQLEQLLAFLGVEAQHDVVVDPQRAFLGQDPLSPVPVLEAHEIVNPLAERQLELVLPGSRSLKIRDEQQFSATALLRTSDEAWGETDLGTERVSRGDEDLPGPLTLAVAVTGSGGAAGGEEDGNQGAGEDAGTQGNGDGTSDEGDGNGAGGTRPAAVIVGSAAFVGNDYLQRIPGNADFVVNAVNWLLGDADRLTIRPKVQNTEPILLTPGAVAAVFYGLVLGLPVLTALAGVGIWWRRRHL
ncbi:MAG: GldG family protein [Symbiobacteriaceae bacterium]